MAFSAWRTWVTGETVTAAQMNQEIKDNGNALFPDENTAPSYTPVLEGSTTDFDTDSVTGRQYRVGAKQEVWARWTFPQVVAQNGSGVMFATLPVAASGLISGAGAGSGQAVGFWASRNDDSTGTNEAGVVLLRSSTTVHFARSVGGVATNTSPFTWDNGDVLSFYAGYTVA